jgi:hypothetical protein
MFDYYLLTWNNFDRNGFWDQWWPPTQHSALNTQHSTLNTQHSTLNTQHQGAYIYKRPAQHRWWAPTIIDEFQL